LIVVAVRPGSLLRGLYACAGTVVTVSAAIAITAEALTSFRRFIVIIFFLPSRALAGFFYLLLYYCFALLLLG
jgi:hypothetical protein